MGIFYKTVRSPLPPHLSETTIFQVNIQTNELTELMIDEHFQTLTTYPPRNFQREAITKLLHRQDILLRAPTGSGKTFCFYSTQ
jgi:superfamily II DNA or RNA helicase